MGVNECLIWPKFGIMDSHITLFSILQLCENWCFGDCTFLMGIHGVTFVQFYLYLYHGTMWQFEREEHLGKMCVQHHGMHCL